MHNTTTANCSVDITQVSREAHRVCLIKMLQCFVPTQDLAHRPANVVQGVLA
jgi:hypothetical protein